MYKKPFLLFSLLFMFFGHAQKLTSENPDYRSSSIGIYRWLAKDFVHYRKIKDTPPEAGSNKK